MLITVSQGKIGGRSDVGYSEGSQVQIPKPCNAKYKSQKALCPWPKKKTDRMTKKEPDGEIIRPLQLEKTTAITEDTNLSN